jgi:predicted glycosyltransferase
MVLAARKPWVVVPEWRYFDEQIAKAAVLEHAGLAAVMQTWPSHGSAWRALWETASQLTPAERGAFVDAEAARDAAAWIDGLATSLWAEPTHDGPAHIVPITKALA